MCYNPRMTLPKRSTWITISLGLLISALGVYLVIRSVDLDQLQRALSAAHYEWALVGTVAITCTFYTRTKRWAVLLQPTHTRGSTLATALLIGQVLNFLLPIRLGDVIRSILAGRLPDLSFERAFGSVAIEKAWDWIGLMAIILIVTLIAPLPAWFVAPARIVGMIALFILLVFAGIAFLPEDARRKIEPRLLLLIDRIFIKLPQRVRFTFVQPLQRLLASLDALRNRRSIWRAAIWTAISWSLSFISNAAILHAFGVDSLPAALLLLAVLMIGIALPPSIAALGIFEGLTILTLGSFGVPAETALAIGIVLHVAIILPPVIVGSILIAFESRAGRSLQFRSKI